MPGTHGTPDFVVVGAMRSGTTSLHHWLRHHPSVFMPAVKELHYFDLHYDRGQGWYEEQFAPAASGLVLGEATPEYMFLPWSRERLSRDLPEAQLVVSLRDPVERAWSHYCMLRERGRESLPFEQALDAESHRLNDHANWSRYGYAAKGHYAHQLEALFELYGRDRVLVLLFERDVVARPREAFSRVCRFIGVDDAPHSAPAVGTSVNAAVRVRSVRVRELSRRAPKQIQDLVGRLNTQPASNAPLPAHLRSRLEREFADSNQALETLLGGPIPEWSSAGVGPTTT